MNREERVNVLIHAGAILFGIGMGILLIQAILTPSLLEQGTREVKCYDRYSNEIIGEKCIDDYYIKNPTYQTIENIGAFMVLSGVIIFMGLFIFVIIKKEFWE